MISKEFFKQLDLLALDKDIPKEKIIEVLKKGFESAYKKSYDDTTMVRVEFDESKAKVRVFGQWLVVSEIDPLNTDVEQILLADAKLKKRTAKIGEIIEQEVTPKDFGRIAALTAKQVLIQGIKNIEREQTFEIFKEKEHEMVTGTVLSYSNGFYTVDLGSGALTSLPEKELLPTDNLKMNSRIKLYITSVDMTPKGPKIFVSRTDAKLVTRVMEQYIPELSDGTIEIRGIARDPGERSKICIASNDSNVDPLGACLGRNGERINDIIEQLNNEKIDLFLHSDDDKILISNSLQPCEVISVLITDTKNKEAIAVVPNDQLSLAIGKKGQNVRLAVNAISWKIDIKSEEDATKAGLKF